MTLRVKWATTQAVADEIIAANRAGEPHVAGCCDYNWIEGDVKLGQDVSKLLAEDRAFAAAVKAWDAAHQADPNADIGRRPTGSTQLRCSQALEPGKRFCRGHGQVYREPDLKKQAKARAQMAKLTKGATKVVEADGTEVYSW
jgi:hypothetical protein